MKLISEAILSGYRFDQAELGRPQLIALRVFGLFLTVMRDFQWVLALFYGALQSCGVRR